MLLAVLIATTATARAEDPNRWQGWVTPTDGQSNAVDVSMVTASPNTCGKKPWLSLQPRYRNRYQEHVAGHLKIDTQGIDGPQSITTEFDLQPGETKIVTAAAFCHDPRKSLAFVIADLHFPERDAEQARIAAAKAAAEKAAAEKAAADKAAKEKAAAEEATAETARREKAKQEAERLAKEGEAKRQSAAHELKAGQQDVEAAKSEEAEAARFREKRQAEAELVAQKQKAPVDELVADHFRRGEVVLGVPVGFQSTKYGSGDEGRFSYGLHGELRLYSWLSKLSGPGEPLSGSGLELTIGGGIATTLDLGTKTSSSKSNLAGGHFHARYWRGAVGIGLFGDWNHYSHSPGMGAATETFDLFALGPELVFGLVASRSVAIEAALRGGAVASGNGLTLDTQNDVFVAAQIVAELNKLYGGAIATRYATSGGIDSSWNALAVFGVRLAF